MPLRSYIDPLGDPTAAAGLPWEGREAARGGGGGPVALLAYADGTFTRTGEAANWDPRTDTWDPTTPYLSTDEPRIFADGAVLLEESRQNVANRDLSAWLTNSVTRTMDPAGVDAPDGGTGVARLDFDNATQGYTLMLGAIVGGTNAALSIWQKRVTSDRDTRCYYIATGGAVQLDWDTGGTAGGGWGRASYRASDHSQRIGVWQSDPGSDLSVDLWGPQVEAGGFPTSYARGTRSAETLSYTAAPAGMRDSAWTVRVWPSFASGLQTAFLFVFGSSNDDRLELTATAARAVQGGTVRAERTSLSWSEGQELTLTVDPSAGTLEVSGASSGNGVSTGTSWTWASGALRVGSGVSGGSQYSGVLSAPVAA